MRALPMLRMPLAGSHGARLFHGSAFALYADAPPGGRGRGRPPRAPRAPPRVPEVDDAVRFEDAPAASPRAATPAAPSPAAEKTKREARPRQPPASATAATAAAATASSATPHWSAPPPRAPRVPSPPRPSPSPAAAQQQPSAPHWSAPPPRAPRAPPSAPSAPATPHWSAPAAEDRPAPRSAATTASAQYRSLMSRNVRPPYKPPAEQEVDDEVQVDEEEEDVFEDDKVKADFAADLPDADAADEILGKRVPRFAERKKTYPKEKIVRTPKPVPVFVRDPEMAGDESLVRLTKKQRPPRVSAGRGQGAFDTRQWRESRGEAPDALSEFSLASITASAERRAREAELGQFEDEEEAPRPKRAPKQFVARNVPTPTGPRKMTVLDKRMAEQSQSGAGLEIMTDERERHRFETNTLLQRAVLPDYLKSLEFVKARKARATKLRARKAQLQARRPKREPQQIEAARVRKLWASPQHSWAGTRLRPHAEPQVTASPTSFYADALLGNPGWSVDQRLDMVRRLAAMEQKWEKDGVFGHEADREIDELLEEI